MKKLIALGLAVVVCGAVFGQSYPNKSKQIEMVIHASAGGTSDTIARFAANYLQKELGVPVVPQNRTGGSGAVAMTYLKNKASDGYTIMYLPVEMAMLDAIGMAKILPSDFDLLGKANSVPATVTIRSDSDKFKTFGELVAYAKANPGKVKVGTAGPASIWTYAGKLLEKELGIKLSFVPYEGGASAALALQQGTVDMITNTPGEFLSQYKDGTFKILGVMTDGRVSLYPEVPTFAEQGYATLKLTAWGGFGAPKGLPADVRATLEKAIAKALQSSEYQELAKGRLIIADYVEPKAFAAFADSQAAFFKRMAN